MHGCCGCNDKMDSIFFRLDRLENALVNDERIIGVSIGKMDELGIYAYTTTLDVERDDETVDRLSMLTTGGETGNVLRLGAQALDQEIVYWSEQDKAFRTRPEVITGHFEGVYASLVDLVSDIGDPGDTAIVNADSNTSNNGWYAYTNSGWVWIAPLTQDMANLQLVSNLSQTIDAQTDRYPSDKAVQNAIIDSQIAANQYTNDGLISKQDKLIAGNGIIIENNVISSTGGSQSVSTYRHNVLIKKMFYTQKIIFNFSYIDTDNTPLSKSMGIQSIMEKLFLYFGGVKSTSLTVKYSNPIICTGGGIDIQTPGSTTGFVEFFYFRIGEKLRGGTSEEYTFVIHSGPLNDMNTSNVSQSFSDWPPRHTVDTFGSYVDDFNIYDRVENISGNTIVTTIQNAYDDTSVRELITSTDAQNDADLEQHKEDDVVKYAAMYDSLANQTAVLQNQILDLKASISNKALSTVNTDITNQTYTVSNTLGGRITGKGIRNVNLLGITLLSTGTVDVNGNRVYDNTSLIGIGDAQTFVMDVADGDAVVSSGMETLIFTPYVSG